MSVEPPSPRSHTWKLDRFYRRTLPAYWVFLAFVTHFPKARIDFGVEASDKIAHFIAYGLLAFLFWRFADAVSRPLSARFAWIAAGTLLCYAALDELTQPFFNRGCELMDWICDAGAVLGVLSVMEFVRRSRERRTFASAAQPAIVDTQAAKHEDGHAGSE